MSATVPPCSRGSMRAEREQHGVHADDDGGRRACARRAHDPSAPAFVWRVELLDPAERALVVVEIFLRVPEDRVADEHTDDFDDERFGVPLRFGQFDEFVRHEPDEFVESFDDLLHVRGVAFGQQCEEMPDRESEDDDRDGVRGAPCAPPGEPVVSEVVAVYGDPLQGLLMRWHRASCDGIAHLLFIGGVDVDAAGSCGACQRPVSFLAHLRWGTRMADVDECP